MTKIDLVNNVIEKIENLRFIIDNESAEFMFFDEMLNTYDFKSVASVFTIAYTDIVSSYLGSVIKDKSFEQIAPEVNTFSILLERFGEFELKVVQSFILGSISDGVIDRVRTCFEDNNAIRCKKRVYEPMQHKNMDFYGDAEGLLNKILDYNSSGEVSIPNLIYYYEAYPNEMKKAIGLIREIKKMKTMLPTLLMKKDEMDAAVSSAAESEDVKDIHIYISKEKIDEGFKDSKICSKFDVIKKHGEEVIKKRKNKVKATKKELKAYEEFLEEIRNLGINKEIKGYTTIISKVPDKKLRLEYLRLVLEHNNQEYKKLDIRLKEYNANTSTKYLALLQEYNIKKDEVDIKLVMRNSLAEVSSMLMLLNNITNNKELRIMGLESSDIDTIVSIKELINKGILNDECLIKYPGLFIKNSDINKTLANNIELCKNYGFDITNLSNNPEVLLSNNQLDKNFKIMDRYGFRINLMTKVNSDTDCAFLTIDNLDNRIDKALELGYESFLDSDLSLLNEDNWDRVYVLKSIGFKPKTKEELLKVLKDETFMMPDSKISNYIHNAVPYCETEFKLDSSFIDDFYNSTRTININEVILSTNRILRDENVTFQSVIKDSILTRDEIETLMAELKQKTYKIEG